MDAFLVSNDLLARPDALRERAREEGYLFFQGLIDAEAVAKVRGEILALCARAGWLKPGTDLLDGIAAPGVLHVEPEPAYMEVYNQVMQLEEFHALAHDPALLAMLADLFEEPPLVHARNIARIIFPQAVRHTTPAHQDYIHIQGTPDTWTAWIPLGDCPQALGSLTLLRGSHRGGIYPTHPAEGAGGLGIDTDVLPLSWVASDFRAGDVLLFHSHTVHKGLPNLSSDRLRLSVDYRYQAATQPVVADSFRPHFGRLSWEEIYAGWKSREHQYYWADLPLKIVEWTPQYHEAARTVTILLP